MGTKLTSSIAFAISALLFLMSSVASAAEPPIADLDRYFGHTKSIKASVPSTKDDINVVQLRIKAPQNIRRAGMARFVVNGSTKVNYHYAGFKDGKHTYLIGVPKRFSGEVDIGAYIDNRIPVENTYKKTRDALVKNTVILGANDIVLLVDISGSMNTGVTGGTRMSLAQKVVNTIGPQLEAEGNNVAVVQYNSNPGVRLGLDQKFSPIGFDAGGGTGTSKAIQTARNMLEGRPSPGKIIISITDGVPSNAGATKNQVNAVHNLKDQGWAIAGIGMGMHLPNYYPIRQFVSNTASNLGLQGAILNMVKTAEEQVRDVNSVCSGNKCKTNKNDTGNPGFKAETITQCGTPVDGDDFVFSVNDPGKAGIHLNSMTLDVDFGDQTIPMKTEIDNQSEIDAAEARGVAPKRLILKASGNMEDSDLGTLFHRANYKAEDEGGRLPYSFKFFAKDLDGNKTRVTETIDPVVNEDTEKPEVKIHAGPGNGDGDIMRNLGDLTIDITDDKTGVDSGYVDFSFKYKDEVYPFSLTPNTEGDVSSDQCVARKPLSLDYDTKNIISNNDQLPMLMDMMIDAFETGDALELKVETEDFAKNQVEEARNVRFMPELVEKQRLRIPGFDHQFNTLDGDPTLSIDAEELAFELDKTTTYYMRLLNDDDLPLIVNGKEVDHKTPVRLGRFPLQPQNEIDLDIASAKDEVEGEATLVLVPADPFSRMVHVPISVWQSDVSLSSKNWEPVQLFDQATARAVQDDRFACDVTGLRDVARSSDPINNPTCYIEWIELPKDTYDTVQGIPMMKGRIPHPGEKVVSYRVLFFDTDGTEFEVDSGEDFFQVIPAKDAIELSLGDRLDNTYRVVKEIDGEVDQIEGPSCDPLTTDKENAESKASMGHPNCLITFTKVPEGLKVGKFDDDKPNFWGKFWLHEGDAEFEWNVSAYSTSGELINIMDNTQVVPLQDPPPPTITMDDSNLLEDDLYWAEKLGDYIGDFVVETINAPMNVELWRGEDKIIDDKTYAGYSDTSTFRSRVMTEPDDLWDTTEYVVKGFFEDLPSVENEKTINVLSVPNTSIRPEATASGKTVLNTKDLLVDVQMLDPYNSESDYKTEDMGLWDIRLLQYMSYSDQEPITEFKAAGNDGLSEFKIDLSVFDDTEFLRILPEARLDSGHESYSRTVKGARPLFVTLLRGEAIDSEIDARRLVGEAPFQLVAGLALENRLDYVAMGDVEWLLREKGDSEWEKLPEQRFTGRLYHTFEAGEYELKSRVHNKNSGAIHTTETIEVKAFEVPDIEVKGPKNAFIGDSADLEIEASVNGEPVDGDEMIIEWSEDDGETWEVGDAKRSISRDQEERLIVRARAKMKNSPAVQDAISDARSRLSFQPVRPPRLGVYGDRVVETDRPVEWRGTIRPPYSNMDVTVDGEFILPDGRVVDGETVEYTATQADAEKERIEVKFKGWVEGFQDQGAEAVEVRPVNVWEYEWPDWEFYSRMSAQQAPAQINLRLRSPSGNIRYLEDLKMEWNVPEGVKVIEDDRKDSRTLVVEEAGDYPVEVTVSDGRGHVSELTYDLDIAEPDPWNVDFRLIKSNDLDRAPLEVRFMPDVSGGHPEDRLRLHRYYLNGNMISEGQRYSSMNLGEGTYDLSLEIETEFGETVRHTEEFTVLPNIPPTCELSARESGVNWRFSAECNDEDGHIADHEWTVDGEKLAMSGGRISVSVRESGTLDVSVKAIDNGGAESDVVRWSGEVTADDRRDRNDPRDEKDEPAEEEAEPTGPNEPPICELSARPWGDKATRFDADCEDPDGRIASYQWYVDGQSTNAGDRRIEIEAEPGQEVLVEVQAKDDKGSSSAKSSWEGVATKAPEQEEDGKPEEADDDGSNIAPTCEIGNRKWSNGVRFTADCKDEDGKISGIEWIVDGQKAATSDTRVKVESNPGKEIVVELIGIDNRGKRSETVSWEGVVTPKKEEEKEKEPEDESGNDDSQSEDNLPPTCEIESRQWGKGMRFNADCEDEDGRIADYQWSVNGEPANTSDRRIIVESEVSQEVSVDLKAVDDSGESSEAASWEGIVNKAKSSKKSEGNRKD